MFFCLCGAVSREEGSEETRIASSPALNQDRTPFVLLLLDVFEHTDVRLQNLLDREGEVATVG